MYIYISAARVLYSYQMPEDAIVTEQIEREIPPEAASTGRSKMNPDGLKPLPKVPGKAGPNGMSICSPPVLIKYWLDRKLNDRPRLICYIYRDHPRCDPTQVLSPEQLDEVKRKKRKAPATNIGKWAECPVDDSAKWKDELLHQFGAGTYHFILNDAEYNRAAGISAGGGRGIAFAETGEIGDYETNPPVLNHDHLLINLPANESYVRWARLKGIRLPGDPKTPFDNAEEEDTDMAASAEINRELTGTINNLVGQLTKEKAPQAPLPPAAPTDSTAAAERVAQVMGNIAEKNFDMLARGMDRFMDSKAEKEDPFAVADKIIALTKQLSGGTQAPAGTSAQDPIVLALLEDRRAMREEISELRRENTKQLTAQLTALEARMATMGANPQAIPPPPESELTKLMMGIIKDKLGDMFSGGAEDAVAPESRFETILKVAAPAVTSGLSNLASIAYNVAQAQKGPQGNPIPPTDGSGAQSPPNGQPPSGPPSPIDLRHFLPLVSEIFKSAIISGQDGAEFAARLLLQYGAPGVEIYRQILSMGGDQFTQQIHVAYPPLGGFINEHYEDYVRFLGEFLDAQRVNEISVALQQASRAPAPKVVRRPGNSGPGAGGVQ